MNPKSPHPADEEKTKNAVRAFLNQFDITEADVTERLITTILKTASSEDSKSELKIFNYALSELYKTFKVFQPYRDFRKVCIFGSARTKPEDPNYQLAETFAKKVTQKGFMVITGAGPGIMEAGNKGSEVNMSFGANISLPFEQDPNPYIGHSNKLVTYRYFFTRKLTFIRESDATVLFPGGFGTHDELFEVLTLVQTGCTPPRPTVLLEAPGGHYWKDWIEFINTHLLKGQLISERDMELVRYYTNEEDAIAYIKSFYHVYHSVQFGNTMTFLRLKQKPSQKCIDMLNSEFSFLHTGGKFELLESGQHPDDNGQYPDLIRLAFSFNKSDYSGIQYLIHTLNDMA